MALFQVCLLSANAQDAPAPNIKPFSAVHTPSGAYTTSWVGNSFGGSGGPNGFGYWIQDGADEIEVTPDGTVLAGVGWDEAGRCVGLYKDGRPNRVLLQTKGDGLPDSAWGWGTGNNALAVSGNQIFIANTGKKLLRFRWTPGDLNSAVFVGAKDLKEVPVGLAASSDRLAVVYKNEIELRKVSDLSPVPGPKVRRSTGRQVFQDAAFAPDGKLWTLSGKALQVEGPQHRPPTAYPNIPGLQNPTAIAFSPKGELIVTDNGPRQQVLIFDVKGAPKPVSTFGEKGGLFAGVPGLVAPKKLFALRGAGLDAKGNLYVGMSYGSGPNGGFLLRSFSPRGKLNWELMNFAFVDTFGFDPDSDGARVYGRDTAFALDLAKPKPGSEATLKAMTLDPVNETSDPRMKSGCTALLRQLEGKRILYTIGQYAGGYHLYTFDEPNGWIAHSVDEIGPKKGEGEQWAWDVDSRGDIWHGDAPGKTIRRYAFKGWDGNKPVYDWSHPLTWPWPEGWQLVRRIHYDPAADSLYLAGYLDADRVETWGVVGASLRRYDGWLKGTPDLRWTVATPRDGNTDPKEGPLTPSSVCFAGDYMFFGMVKPTNEREYVHAFRVSDGGYAGSFEPGPAVVGKGDGVGVGWLDMPYSTQAFKRKNGEYLILAEEDWRGKNLLYRWKPLQ